MTLAHFVYIPGILVLGMVIGWVLGGRAAETARADKQEKDRARAARRARAAAEDPPEDERRPPA